MGYDIPMKQTKPLRSTLRYSEAVDAYGLFWQGKLAQGVYAEAHAVINGEMLAADDPADFVLPTGKTSLEIYNQGY